MDMDLLPLNTVVHFKGGRRRYIVVSNEKPDIMGYMLRALTGGEAGSGPSGVKRGEIEIDANQKVAFAGPKAARLYRVYAEYIGYFGKRPDLAFRFEVV